MDSQGATSLCATSLILRLAFPHLPKKSQIALLRLDHATREYIFADINLLWKQRLEQRLDRVFSGIRIDWRCAYKLACEDVTYLSIVLPSYFPPLDCPTPSDWKHLTDLQAMSVREDHPCAMQLCSTPWSREMHCAMLRLAVITGSARCLTVLLSRGVSLDGKESREILLLSINDDTSLRLLLRSPSLKISAKDITDAMTDAVRLGRRKAFNMLLNDRRAVYKSYYNVMHRTHTESFDDTEYFCDRLLRDSRRK